MMTSRPSTALGFLLLATLAVADDDAERESIAAARAQSNDAIARHDVAGITSHYDDEYQITTSLGRQMQGREGEDPAWRQLFDTRQDVVYVRSPETIEISSDYPLAAETGHWLGTWSTDDGEVRTGGRYAAMWRKVDGEWKIRSELFVALYCEGAACP